MYCRGGAPLGRPPPDQGQVQTLRQNFPVQGRLQCFTGTHLQHLRSSRRLFVAKLPYLALRLLRRHQKIRHFHCLPNFCMSGSKDSWITIFKMMQAACCSWAGWCPPAWRASPAPGAASPTTPPPPARRRSGGPQSRVTCHVSRVTCYV